MSTSHVFAGRQRFSGRARPVPDVPEGLDGKIWIPQLDGLRLVQN